jgi:hypothetical protein
MKNSCWSDDCFLDRLRALGDVHADQCVADLIAQCAPSDFHLLFRSMKANDDPLPADLPKPLQAFFEQTNCVPKVGGCAVDEARIQRGEEAFTRHLFPAAMVLLLKSVPEGYAAPNLSRILAFSDNLNKRPYARLLGVLQMVINVSCCGGFEKSGRALITARKMRLLHAGVRHIVRERRPDLLPVCKTPVNLEDMLGTIMGFSLLVVEGLNTFECGLTSDQAEDFYYVWRVFAQMCGIHPAEDADSSAYVPADLAEAAEFYASYRRRHYRPASENPDGVVLARSLLRMFQEHFIPPIPWIGPLLRRVPEIYMQELSGREAMLRIGLRPSRFHFINRHVLNLLPRLMQWFAEAEDCVCDATGTHDHFGRMFFDELIKREFGGEVTFCIPEEREHLRGLAEPQDAVKS